MRFLSKKNVNTSPFSPALDFAFTRKALGSSRQTLAIACSASNTFPPLTTCVWFPLFFFFFCAFQREKHFDFQREEQQKQEDRMADTASDAAGPGSDTRMKLQPVGGF